VLLKTCNRGLWEYNREGPHGAIILRYADCSLRCHICYAQRYAYLNIYDKDVESANLEECITGLRDLSETAGWIRIQGGEPLLNDRRSFATAKIAVESLEYLSKHSPYPTPRVIIQTNGLWLSGISLKKIKDFVRILKDGLLSIERGRVAIEVSIKGPNSEDANLYALSKPSDVTSTVLSHQIVGFKKLTETVAEKAWRDKQYGLAVYPVAGLGPEISRPGFIPLSPSTLAKGIEWPIFHRATWSKDFAELVEYFRITLEKWDRVYGDYIIKHDNKLPLEGMDESYFQMGWISQIKKRAELEHFLEHTMRADWTNTKLNLFRKRYVYLSEIISQASNELIKKVGELGDNFYDSEPAFHYPYL